MSQIRSIALFSGSSMGNTEHYLLAARSLAKAMAARNLSLVYGGGNLGLMGAAAEILYKNGNAVTAVLPSFFDTPAVRTHRVESEMIITETMHERKAIMYAQSDAFIALPGGVGTFEELLECITWKQLGLHHKPIALYNTASFYDPLLSFLTHSANEGFIQAALLDSLIVESDAEVLFDRLISFGSLQQ
ncbi:MAG TPA: TIGR00730 family Rossman fold protein [Sphaerochaeta sp.]|nr:TIGR00730 family Rossman fold protein [Sphaerochaeta sp.]